MPNDSTIRLLATGGTIDKFYNELNGQLPISAESNIPKMLAQGRCKANITIQSLLQKDSLDMDETDRTIIRDACLQSQETQIIITHGTDTMAATAKTVAATIKDKTVVLVGAMIPYTLKNSDALFNLGAAVSAVQLLAPGVYIVMNGKVFSWDNVTKNLQAGLFEALD